MFSIMCKIAIVAIAFLYPAYSTFKTLDRRPGYENEAERWLMYWAIAGFLASLEYSVEWAISWFPFYWEVKTVFMIYLVLPQTQGTTYIYKTYLRPQLRAYEPMIDAEIGTIAPRVIEFVRGLLMKGVSQAAGAAANTSGAPQDANGNGGAPSLSGLAQGLWTAFAPAPANQTSPVYQPSPSKTPNETPPAYLSASPKGYEVPPRFPVPNAPQMPRTPSGTSSASSRSGQVPDWVRRSSVSRQQEDDY